MNPSKISFTDTSFFYQNKQILAPFSLAFEPSGFYALLGENGSGKSTFMKALLLDPSVKKSGAIRLEDNDLTPDMISRWVAHMPQSLEVSLPFRVLDVVMMGHPNYINFFEKNKDQQEAAEKQLEFLKITHLAHRNIQTLSGGERALVFLAKILCKGVNILILDEPDSALDYKNKRRLFEILEQFKKEKLIIMSSHDPELSRKHVDFIIPIINGSVAPTFSAKHLTDDKITQIYSL